MIMRYGGTDTQNFVIQLANLPNQSSVSKIKDFSYEFKFK